MSIFQKAIDRHLAQRRGTTECRVEEVEYWLKWERERQELERRRTYRHSLALAKDTAHFYFDRLWQSGFMSRAEAYAWLSRITGIPSTECHMAQFDIGLCEAVARLSLERLQRLQRLRGGIN